MDTTEKKIMDLVLVAYDHQKSVEAMLERLAMTHDDLHKTRLEFELDHESLHSLVQSVEQAADTLHSKYRESIPLFRGDITRGVNEAVSRHFEIIENNSKKLLLEALTPLLEKTAAAVGQAETATRDCHKAVNKLTSRNVSFLAFGISAILLSVVFAVQISEKIGLTQEVDYLRQEKGALTEKISQQYLQGGAMNTTTCDDSSKKKRFCIELPNGKPEIINYGNRFFVVPRGY